MKQNPVYKRECRVSARSLRLPAVVTVFGGILSLTALYFMYSIVSQARSAAAIQYDSFLDIYQFTACGEFVMLICVAPAMTVSSISGERERQTLDILLTTQMTPAQILWGKLFGALSNLFLLILIGLPALCLAFVFGGATWVNLLALGVCFGTTALLGGCVGILFSAFFKKTVISSAASYGTMALIVGGTYLVNQLFMSLDAGPLSYSLGRYGMGVPQPSSSGMAFYLLLLNPGATFYTIIKGQTGQGDGVGALKEMFGIVGNTLISDHWVLLSLLIQLSVSVLLFWLAVGLVNPLQRRPVRK